MLKPTGISEGFECWMALLSLISIDLMLTCIRSYLIIISGKESINFQTEPFIMVSRFVTSFVQQSPSDHLDDSMTSEWIRETTVALDNFILFFNIISFLTSLLEYNCFTLLCQLLLCNRVNQLYVYIYPHIPSLLRLAPTLPDNFNLSFKLHQGHEITLQRLPFHPQGCASE